MRIFIEDYFGNDLCSINIDSFTDLCQRKWYTVRDLTDCSLADEETDANGTYIRIQLNNK